MTEALGAMALVCRWLVRDRARQAAPLEAARQELDKARERLDVATLRRDAMFAERAALDRELTRLVHRCDRLAEAREQVSAERDEAVREREGALAELRRVQEALKDARDGHPHARDLGSAPAGVAVRGSSAEHSGVEPGPQALLASFVRGVFGPRGAVAIAALGVAMAVLLILLGTH